MHRPTALHRRSALTRSASCCPDVRRRAPLLGLAGGGLGPADRQGPACLRATWPDWLDQTVRPYVAAYGYLLCGFDALHRLGRFNRLALAGEYSAARRSTAPWRRYSRLRAGATARPAPTAAAHGPRAGAPGQPQRALRGPDHGGAASACTTIHGWAGGASHSIHPTRRGRHGLRRSAAAAQQGQPMTGAGRPRRLDGLGRALVRDLDAHARGAPRAPRHPAPWPGDGWQRNSPDRLAGGLDARDLRRVGRAGRRMRHRRLRAAAGSASPAALGRRSRRTTIAGYIGADRAVLPRLPGVGLVRPALRSRDARSPRRAACAPCSAPSRASSPTTSGPSCCGPGSTSPSRTSAAAGTRRLPTRSSSARSR